MGAALDHQLPGSDRFSAGRTHRTRMELGAARVLEDDRRGARVQLLIAPFLEREDDGAKLGASLGQVILVAGRVLLVDSPLEYADFLETAQPTGQYIPRRPGEPREVAKPDVAVANLTNDQQRVAITHDREGVGNRADPLCGFVFQIHSSNIATAG